MEICRVCGESLGEPIYRSAGISISSVRSVSDASLIVFLCPGCLHVQKPALPSTPDYYDREYQISLESDDFDQLYDKVGERCIYRTDYQAELVLKSVDIPPGANILDFGAGKATSLMKVWSIRPDIVAHVYDVSDAYRGHWRALPAAQQATYTLPASWRNSFSLVMAHFVVEHVEDPCAFFRNIADLLADDGSVYFTVPNVLSNPGDLIAVDHINHFSMTSLHRALKKANLSLVTADDGIFRGAIVCVARPGPESLCPGGSNERDFKDRIFGIVRFWSSFDAHLAKTSKRLAHVPAAIFGAGVYGSYIAAHIQDSARLRCFLDNSPHLRNSRHMGLPVLAPDDMPDDIRVIYSGLNPGIARGVLESLTTHKNISEIIFFDAGAYAHD